MQAREHHQQKKHRDFFPDFGRASITKSQKVTNVKGSPVSSRVEYLNPKGEIWFHTKQQQHKQIEHYSRTRAAQDLRSTINLPI